MDWVFDYGGIGFLELENKLKSLTDAPRQAMRVAYAVRKKGTSVN